MNIEIKKEEFFKRNIGNSYEKLSNARVCILGLGGLGSNIANNLVRSGVGNLKLVDFDMVEASNLNRQMYRINHIGMKKTDALKEILLEISPFTILDVEHVKVTKENVLDIVKEYDIVVEAFDNAETKSDVINEIIFNYDDKYIVSGSGMAGIEDSNNIKTIKRFDKLYICGDGYSDFEEFDGMMSPRVSICAGHQANQVLRLILLDK